ncbi:MAG: arsenate reductase family protein [Oscillospiraceae bacterium]|jgi:arsenate reductase-like glutaredoxin family protein|nr:arsenate reductase family protein [Oscillospiraceae bacterium]
MSVPKATIQVFGKAKCFDTKKALRFFKERGVPVQEIDILRKGLSAGEYRSVRTALGGDLDALIDDKGKAYGQYFVAYLAGESAKESALLAHPELYRTPIVRQGKRATIGYEPQVWARWLGEG